MFDATVAPPEAGLLVTTLHAFAEPRVASDHTQSPGITFDGDVGTKDFNSDLTFLGTVLFPAIGTQNWLPVGQALIFQSANLDQFVADAVTGGATQVTLVSTVIHGADTPFSTWLNFNYLFNPKEQTTLNSDPNYDADINDPGNPLGSPFSGADNSTGLFSPALLIQSTAVPVPHCMTCSRSSGIPLVVLVHAIQAIFMPPTSVTV